MRSYLKKRECKIESYWLENVPFALFEVDPNQICWKIIKFEKKLIDKIFFSRDIIPKTHRFWDKMIEIKT